MLAAPTPAAAFERLADRGPVETDGRSVAIWQASGGLRIWRDGARAAETRPLGLVGDCGLEGVAARKALFNCAPKYKVDPVLFDLATGDTSRPPGADKIKQNSEDGADHFFFGFGRALIGILWIGKGGGGHYYHDWHAGTFPRIASTRRTTLTLDEPSGAHEICPSLRRPRRDTGAVYSRGRLLVRHLDGALVLNRCGSRRSRMLARWAEGEPAPVMTRRYAAWLGPKRTYAYIFRSRRVASWPSPGRPYAQPLLLRATADRLFVVDQDNGQSYVARVPER
jgi:hypothetical protein